MSGRGGKALTVMAIGAIGWYTGIQFWQPIIIEQLKKDGNLREDVYVKDYSDQPKSWQDLKDKVRETLHPGVDFEKSPAEAIRESKEATNQDIGEGKPPN